MAARARLKKLEGVLIADLEAKVDELKAAFWKTIPDEDLQAYMAALNWLEGATHGQRPKPEVWAKAFSVRERMPHDLLEAGRRLAVAMGFDMPGD